MDLHELREAANRWSRGHDSIDRTRIDAICYISHESLRNLEIGIAPLRLSKMMLWLFAVDDIFDSTEFDIEAAVDAERFLVERRIREEIDPMLLEKCRNTRDIYEEITTDIPARLQERCEYVYAKMLRGMVLEKTNSFESYEHYMSYAKYTIGIPVILFPLLARTHEIDLACLELTGEIVRLLNDIRSYEREQQDGKRNAIDFLATANDQHARIHHSIDRKLNELKALLEYRNGDGVSAFILRIISLIEGFYEKHDFHEFEIE